MKSLFIGIMLFIWGNQIFFLITNFSILSAIYFLFLSYGLLILIGLLDFRKYVLKNLFISLTILLTILISAYQGMYTNEYIYLLFIFIAYIILLKMNVLKYKKEYLEKEIDNFINETVEAKKEIQDLHLLIEDFNIKQDKMTLGNLRKENEENFIENIKLFKLFLLKKSFNELIIQGLNKDAYKLIEYLNKKYGDYVNEEKETIFTNVISKIHSSSGDDYLEGIVEFYNCVFGYDENIKPIISVIGLLSSYSTTNIVIRLQTINMQIFFKGIGNIPIK